MDDRIRYRAQAPRRMGAAAVALAVLCALASASGCGPGPASAKDATEAARLEAGRRLTGEWLLMSYQPEVPLEPMFAGLLAAQLGTMLVRFDGQQMVAGGTGLSVTRRYRVTQAQGDRVTLVLWDDKGIAYDAVGEHRGAELWFASLTSPWRGRGVLRRASANPGSPTQ